MVNSGFMEVQNVVGPQCESSQVRLQGSPGGEAFKCSSDTSVRRDPKIKATKLKCYFQSLFHALTDDIFIVLFCFNTVSSHYLISVRVILSFQ